MFGFPAARLDFLLGDGEDAFEIERRLLQETLDSARKRGILHMVGRVPAGDLCTTHALEQSGFERIDAIQTFSLGWPWRDFAGGREARLFEERDLQQILEIARRSYVFDRFHADTAIAAATADRIHEEWLLNCCRGTAADAVVVVREGAIVLGYATCKIDGETREGLGLSIGSIGMVATAERARRRGVAVACTAGALGWFQSRNVGLVQVGTQGRNMAAARLYEKCGFRLTSNALTLRKLL